jgi:acyl carrier protein
MSKGTDVEKILLRVAQVMIDELKLEDVTPETFDPEIDLIDEVGIDSMDHIRLISEYIDNKLKDRS